MSKPRNRLDKNPKLKPERIAKYLARAGVASRREVERMIAAGRIYVGGKKLDTPAFLVTGDEKILVDGKPVKPRSQTRVWRYHKPAGLLTTNKDPEGRAIIYDNLPKSLPRLISVGRLDMNTEGLLLLTNDGELARKMELPATGFSRRYRARAFGKTTQEALDKLKHGIMIDGQKTKGIEAVLDKVQGGNVWISLSLRDGKNREVRRALESLGLKVNRLIRISYGPFQLGDLAKGAVEEIKPHILKDQLGHLASFGDAKPQQKTVRKPKRKGGGGAHCRR